MATKMMKFDGLDSIQDDGSNQQTNAEDTMFGVAETTGNLEKAAELFQDLIIKQNSTFMDFQSFDYSNFQKPPPNYPKLASAAICNVLGTLCIFLNFFVVISLLRNRKRVLSNVFYVLVLHCAFVDLIRGSCLVAWSVPHLLINSLQTMQDRLLVLKINQCTLVILRSCNLLTIFNLLVFTTNEFIVIKYPLHYRRYFRRRTVIIILICSWLISLFFGVGSVFSNFFESAHSIMVLNNGSFSMRGNSSVELSEGVTRRQTGGLSINIICMLIIFVLCYLCLTIRNFHSSTDTKGRFHSEEGQKFNRNTIRNVNLEIDKDGKTSVVVPPSSISDTPSKWMAEGCSQQPNGAPRCNSHRKWRSHLMSRHKYLIVIGSVLFVDVLFLFPYSGIQLVAFLHLSNMMGTTPKATLIRWGLQILIGIHSVCQPLCYFRMNEFRRLACCFDQTKISRSKSFSQDKSIGCSEGQSRDGPTNDRDTNTPAIPVHQHHNNKRRESKENGSITDPTSKRYPNPVRRLSRLMSRGLLDSSSDSSCEFPDAAATQMLVPTVEIDPEVAHTPSASELEYILECGLQQPFLESNWNRVVGASLRFRNYGERDDVRPKLSTLSDMRSSTCFERESICLPDDPEQ
ncbi:Beta-2 adrenergic receptor [Aphelenchoides bicaudatus]|nr:Beta-2 adrenergic receptor [Aphelenchoides bicaudatus]